MIQKRTKAIKADPESRAFRALNLILSDEFKLRLYQIKSHDIRNANMILHYRFRKTSSNWIINSRWRIWRDLENLDKVEWSGSSSFRFTTRFRLKPEDYHYCYRFIFDSSGAWRTWTRTWPLLSPGQLTPRGLSSWSRDELPVLCPFSQPETRFRQGYSPLSRLDINQHYVCVTTLIT